MIKHGWSHDFDDFDDLKNFFIIWELFRFSDSQRRFSTFSGIFLNISDFTGGFLVAAETSKMEMQQVGTTWG